MQDLDRLVAIEAIKALKARYFRYVDTQFWNDFRKIFADDATLFFPENNPDPVTIDNFMPGVAAALKGGISIHHGHMPEIEIMTLDTARAIWPMDDHLFFPPDVPGIANASEIRGAGHYHETYVRQNGNWLIKTLKLTRLRLQVIPKARMVA